MIKKILSIIKAKIHPDIKTALYLDGGQVQIACPECLEIQINFSTMDLYLHAPDFLECEICKKTMKIAAT